MTMRNARAQAAPAAFSLRAERTGDEAAIEAIHARAFGPGRFARAAFRVRERAAHAPALSFVAEAGGGVIGSVRLTRVDIGGRGALLLGPLAVTPAQAGRGIGRALMGRAMAAAREDGHGLVVLVGDPPYYARFGFRPVPAGRIAMPNPVDPARLLAAELAPGALAAARGVLSAPRDTT